MNSLQAFSWGYWGWGTQTREFVQVADTIERSRAKRPPFFVDVRYRRSGRAPGFVGSAFEETVGEKRYLWLRKLGNERIGSGRGGIKIADRSGVEDLLQLIAEKHQQHGRVIFFCACKPGGDCHRRSVAQLLADLASRKGIELSVAEWPGEKPRTFHLRVPPNVVDSILRGTKRVPLNTLTLKHLRNLYGLPWGSRVALHSDKRQIAIVSGPAGLDESWYLPVLNADTLKPTDTIENLGTKAKEVHKEFGFTARSCAKS